MDIANRLIAPSGKPLNVDKFRFDLDGFIRKIILFDHYILDSQGLRELPALINAFTFGGFIDLLESGVMSINLYPVQTASRGPSLMGEIQWPGGIRPPYNYSLAVMSPADPYQYINVLYDQVLPKLQLSRRQPERLIKAIYAAKAKPQTQPNNLAIESTLHDILNTRQLLARFCSYVAKRKFKKEIPSSKIKLDLTKNNTLEIKVRNNLETDLGLTQLEAHRTIENAILLIASQYDRIELMKWHSAVSGFRNEDLPLFAEKFDFLFASLDPEIKEKRFQRVIEVRGLNVLKADPNLKIDVQKLLSIREKKECLELRNWLCNIDELTNEQVRNLNNSIFYEISGSLQSTTGKVLRFLTTSLVGLILPPGLPQMASIVVSALDSFLLDRLLLPKPGPIMFIDEFYPSIFKEDQN